MGKRTIEASIYETELRQTQSVLRKVQRLLRDPKLARPNLKSCAGIPVVEDLVGRREYGEFPTPLHEILELNKIIESENAPEVKRWARQRIRNLKKRIK